MIKKIIWLLTTLFFSLVVSLCFAGSSLLLVIDRDTSAEMHWDERMLPYKWQLNEQGVPGPDITNEALLIELENAFSSWQAIPESNISFEYLGETALSNGGVGSAFHENVDGNNIITFVDNDFLFAPGVVAVCMATSFVEETVITDDNNDLNGDGITDIPNGTYSAGTIFDADILFNANQALVISGESGTADIQAIALHEIGHCIGLDHSSIDNAVMKPVLDNDIGLARTLKADDIATTASLHQELPIYETTYGSISGRVLDGRNGSPLTGVHVYAVDSSNGEAVVGAYSLQDGRYNLPVPEGTYFVAIEPMDSAHPGLEPRRFNAVIAVPDNTFFPRENYDTNEGAIEKGEETPESVVVVAGQISPDIDFVTNIGTPVGFSYLLQKGINHFSYPEALPDGLTAFEFLNQLKDNVQVNRIQRFNPDTASFEQAVLIDNEAFGEDFNLALGEGYIISSSAEATLVFPGETTCNELSLNVGFNLMGASCVPAEYSSFDLLAEIGESHEVESVEGYNRETGVYERAYYLNSGDDAGEIVGDDFDIDNGYAYIVRMFQAKAKFIIGEENKYPPSLTMISPGVGIKGSEVALFGKGFSPQRENNIVTFDRAGAEVIFASAERLLVRVPDHADVGINQVSVTINGLVSESLSFQVEESSVEESEDGVTALLSGQTAQGELSGLGEQDLYTFSAAAGNRVTIQAHPLENAALDLKLELLSPSGFIVATDDNSGYANDPKINNQLLQETGIYTIVISGNTTGKYELSIQINSDATQAKVHIMQGGVQTAVAGSELEQTLLVMVTDDRGQPLANAQVVLNVVSESETIEGLNNSFRNKKLLINGAKSNVVNQSSIQSSGAITSRATNLVNGAGIRTDSYGVAAITVEAPDLTENYTIKIDVPGIVPSGNQAEMQVYVIDKHISTIIIEKRLQDCGGEGCVVDQNLPDDWVIEFLDSDNNGIPNVSVEWRVVAGEGTVGNTVDTYTTTSTTDGKVMAKQKLGAKVYVNEPEDFQYGEIPLIPISHLVIATIPGQSAPVIFEGVAKEGNATQLEQQVPQAGYRVSLSSRHLNAIKLLVRDANGNPVANEPVTYNNPDSGLEVTPGLFGNKLMTGMATNERGIWIGAIGAESGVAVPTMDEFQNTDVEGLASIYSLNLTAVNQTIEFSVQVDMGPAISAFSENEEPGALVGQPINKDENTDSRPGFRISTYRRLDDPILVEEEGGLLDFDWSNETDFTNLVQFASYGETIPVYIHYGGNAAFSTTEKAKLVSHKIIMCPENGCPQTSEEWALIDVSDEEVMSHFRQAFADLTTIGTVKHNNIQVLGKPGVYKYHIYVPRNCPEGTSAEDCEAIVWPALEMDLTNRPSGLVLTAEPVTINIELEDGFDGVIAVDDPYPGIPVVSGLNLKELSIKLNGTEIDLTALELGKYPNYAQMVMDSKTLRVYDQNVKNTSRPQKWQLIYYPKSTELNTGTNTINITKLKDSVDNEVDDASTTLTCTFEYPADEISCVGQ